MTRRAKDRGAGSVLAEDRRRESEESWNREQMRRAAREDETLRTAKKKTQKGKQWKTRISFLGDRCNNN